MKLMVYKPSVKGIKAGINPHKRIMFLNEHYIHINACKSGYYFSEGDAFEWRPGLKKPESYWVSIDEVETTALIDSVQISKYNRDVNADELKLMGI